VLYLHRPFLGDNSSRNLLREASARGVYIYHTETRDLLMKCSLGVLTPTD